MAKNEVSSYFERHRRRKADWRRRVEQNPAEAAFWAKVNERKARIKAQREAQRKAMALRAYKEDLADKLAMPVGLFAECQSLEDVDAVAEQVCKDVLDTTPKKRMEFVQKARQQYNEWLREVKQVKPVGADWGADFLVESAKFEEELDLPKLRALLNPPPQEAVSFADLYGVKPEGKEEDDGQETDTSA